MPACHLTRGSAVRGPAGFSLNRLPAAAPRRCAAAMGGGRALACPASCTFSHPSDGRSLHLQSTRWRCLPCWRCLRPAPPSGPAPVSRCRKGTIAGARSMCCHQYVPPAHPGCRAWSTNLHLQWHQVSVRSCDCVRGDRVESEPGRRLLTSTLSLLHPLPPCSWVSTNSSVPFNCTGTDVTGVHFVMESVPRWALPDAMADSVVSLASCSWLLPPGINITQLD